MASEAAPLTQDTYLRQETPLQQDLPLQQGQPLQQDSLGQNTPLPQESSIQQTTSKLKESYQQQIPSLQQETSNQQEAPKELLTEPTQQEGTKPQETPLQQESSNQHDVLAPSVVSAQNETPAQNEPSTQPDTNAQPESSTQRATATQQENNKSFVLHEPNKVAYEDRPVPSLTSPYDVLVRVAWTGICGSDVHYYLHGRIGTFVLNAPMTLGHESSGTIHAVGSAVKSVKVGDRVALEPGVPCRRCEPCKSGAYNLCAEMAFASTPPYSGTLCKYYSLPADFCYKLPDHVSLEAGALIEPTAVAVHVVRQGGITAGNTVIVFGAGPVGLLCAAVAMGFGASKVVVVDIVEARLEFAKSWVKGDVGTFIPSKDKNAQENSAALIEQHGLGEGADVVLEASGAAPSAQTAVWAARRGGTYVQAGMGADSIQFPIMGLCSRELTAKGSFRYKEGDYRLAVSLVASGVVDAEKLISSKVKFEEAEEAFGKVKRGEAIKVLIQGVQD